MNCTNCNAKINYNYLTACPQCGDVVEGSDLPKFDQVIESGKEKRAWPYYLGNTIYVLLTSLVSMVAVATVGYLSAGVIYLALETPETHPGEHCARGMAIGMLSIMIGGFLGTVAGAVFSTKHPVLKHMSSGSI
jgi:hypothetical protein